MTSKFLTLFQKLIVVNIVVALSMLVGGQAEAVNFTFTKIVDSNTPIPNGNGNFSRRPSGLAASFNVFSASIDNNNIAFQGFGSDSQSGIYANIGGVLSVVADTNTPIPNGTGNFAFGSFGQSFGGTFDLDGNNIAFVGIDSNSQSGVYTNIGGVLSKIADTNTPIPDGTGNFSSFFGPALEGDTLAFSGSRSDPETFEFLEGAIYTSVNGVLSVVPETNTLIPPGGIGQYTFVSSPSLDGDTIAFSRSEFFIDEEGNFIIGQDGIYTSIGGVLNVIADTNTPILGGSSNFEFFGDLSIEDDTVTFLASGGIYRSVGGNLDVVVESNTILPDGNKLCGFDPFISVEGNNIVFGSIVCDPVTNAFLTGGIYAYLDENLVKVIDFEDSLDGKEVSQALFAGSNVLNKDSIAFWVRFRDGSDGIYLAQVVPESVPEEPSSILGLSALGFLGGGVMLKRIKQKQKV
jgi:hypothetical protein